jgi:hypothetical protein
MPKAVSESQFFLCNEYKEKMDLFGTASKPTNVNVKITNNTAKNAVNTAGKTLKNSLASAQSVKEALLTVSDQLKQAANTLNSNKAAVAESAASTVQANLPAAAEVAKQVGGSSAAIALMGGLPKSVIAGGARRAVEEGVRQLRKLSGAAREGANAINTGMGMVAKGAAYVARNAKRVDMRRVNRALEGAGRVANNNVPSNLNVNVSSNLNSELNTAVSNNAEELSKMAAGFNNSSMRSRRNMRFSNERRGSRRSRSRKNGGFSNDRRGSMRFANERRGSRKNGGFSNNMRFANERKDSRKNGGFFSSFF